MFRKSLSMILIFSALFSLNSCRDTVEKETVIREVEVSEDPEVRVEVEEDKGLLEEAGEEIDQEVNEEISEEIEKIGDDN